MMVNCDLCALKEALMTAFSKNWRDRGSVPGISYVEKEKRIPTKVSEVSAECSKEGIMHSTSG